MKKFLTFTDKKTELVKKQTRILCAISSGQDSIVTFFVLLHAKKKKIFNLEIIYCQHFWQTKNFFSAVFVFKLGFLFEIPYNIVLPQNSLLTENRSRAWRKNFFFRVARLENLLNVVTGQTLTDKLEKFFNNLFRGVAPKSLSESNLLNYKKTGSFFFSTLNLKPKFFTSKVSLKGNDFKQENKKFYHTKKNKIKRSRLKKGFNFSNTRRTQTWKNLQFQCFSITKTLTQTKITQKYLTGLPDKQLSSCSFCLYSRNFTIQIIYEKPLLEKARFTISKLVKFYDFPLITDMSNFSTNFSRNKIRYHFLPLIRYLFHTKFEFLIKNFLRTLELEQKILDNEISGISFLLKTKKVIKTQKLSSKIDNVGKKKTENRLVQKKEFFLERKKNKIKTTNLLPFSKRSFELNPTKKRLLDQQRSLIRKLFSDYTDLELTYFQTCKLQDFLNN